MSPIIEKKTRMQRTINGLVGHEMEATDGVIGRLYEFYFDDNDWRIRYLILKTDNWLSGRKVLIAPEALMKISPGACLLRLNLSRDQIRKSPDIDTDKPVCRQQEIELYNYYSWQGYWKSGFYGEGLPESGKDVDLHLRSSMQVTGYPIYGTDGEIGITKDFIVDEQDWKITELVAEISHRNAVKEVLISIGEIKPMLWSDSEIYVNLNKDAITKCKLFDAGAFAH